MARKNDAEAVQDITANENVTPEAETNQNDLMAQLKAMQEELAAKMAALEEREANLKAREEEMYADDGDGTGYKDNHDAWSKMKTLFVPPGANGEQKYYYVCVNGKGWKIPRGRMVEMPEPIYERMVIMLERDAAARMYRESVPENGEIGSAGVKATRM